MENSYFKLLENNKAWVVLQSYNNSEFFKQLSTGQSPDYLWIGCSDSRVPANQITGTTMICLTLSMSTMYERTRRLLLAAQKIFIQYFIFKNEIRKINI